MAEETNVKHTLQPLVASCYSATRSPRLGVTFGSHGINPIPPNGFALAASLHFMLFGHVAFAEQNRRVRATEILTQRGEEPAFVEPGNPTIGYRSP